MKYYEELRLGRCAGTSVKRDKPPQEVRASVGHDDRRRLEAKDGQDQREKQSAVECDGLKEDAIEKERVHNRHDDVWGRIAKGSVYLR
jgi:hypothetical protein